MHGVVAVYKPAGITSAAAVSRIKRLLTKQVTDGPRRLKVGHGGTLDKRAEGVLVIGVGRGCKLLKTYLGGSKEYVVTAQLGLTTSSYDMDGDVLTRPSFSHVSRANVLECMQYFEGTTMQDPPPFSALKVKGRRLSDYARAGISVDVPARPVTITQLDLCYFSPPFITLHVECLSGLYVRSLIRDLGQALDTGATVSTLIRTRVADFGLLDALQPENWTPQHLERALRWPITGQQMGHRE